MAKVSREIHIDQKVLALRGYKVMLDSDLAAVYGVSTKRLNEQLRRNRKKFPSDFAFQLTKAEWQNLGSQNVTSSYERNTAGKGDCRKVNLRSQIATSSSDHGGRRYLPYVLTEHGALQAANVLNSPRATAMSIYVIRAFIKLREQLAANELILRRLAEIDQTLLTHDAALRDIYQKLLPLLSPPPEPPRPEIGFHMREDTVPYRIKRKFTARDAASAPSHTMVRPR